MRRIGVQKDHNIRGSILKKPMICFFTLRTQKNDTQQAEELKKHLTGNTILGENTSQIAISNLDDFFNIIKIILSQYSYQYSTQL